MKPFLPNDNLNVDTSGGGAEAMPHAIVAAFPDHAAADKAADDLRNMGVANERIAVLWADTTVNSVANAPQTYRATDIADSSQKEQDATPAIIGADRDDPSPATPSNPDQDFELAMHRADHVDPDRRAVISVTPGAGDADAIMQTLQAAGGVLQRRATDRRLTDHGSEDPESNSRVA